MANIKGHGTNRRFRVTLDDKHVTVSRLAQTAIYRLREAVLNQHGPYDVISDQFEGADRVRVVTFLALDDQVQHQGKIEAFSLNQNKEN